MVTHQHDSGITMPSEVVDVKDTNLAALSAAHAFDPLDPLDDLCVPALRVGANFFYWRSIKIDQRGTRLVDRDLVLGKTGDQS
jgi:hypothetical protein